MKDSDHYNMMTGTKRLISEEFYFKSIFKKTEKIVCAVSYLLAHTDENVRDSAPAQDLEDWALKTLSFIGETLLLQEDKVSDITYQLANKLVVLESKLRVLYARGGIHREHLNVFVAEIDTVLRAVRSLDKGVADSAVILFAGTEEQTLPRPVSRKKIGGSTPASSTSGTSGDDRRDRIKAILQAAQKASIKDITDTIKDCSEKTIQRELNAMIKDNLVSREGERRWSTYSYIGQ